MLDIDHFKRINDTYGHATGDAVLKYVAGLLRGSLRKIDTVGRIGGEEFAAILPGTDLAAAESLADRVRVAVAMTPAMQAGQIIPATLSIGVASMSLGDVTAEAALARADEALYRAKQRGRNRVEVAAEVNLPRPTIT